MVSTNKYIRMLRGRGKISLQRGGCDDRIFGKGVRFEGELPKPPVYIPDRVAGGVYYVRAVMLVV